MALAYALTDTTAVKAQLGISGSTYDTILDRMIDSATLYAESFIGRYIKGRGSNLTVLLDVPEATQDIFLRNFPIISVTSVTDDGTVISSNDYYKYDDTGRLSLKSGSWSVGRQTLSIVYQGGYANVPADLIQWCVSVVGAMFQNRNNNNVIRETVGTITVEYVSDFISKNEFLRDTLARYKSNHFTWD